MANKTINLNDDALDIWNKRFSEATTGFGDFSSWVSGKLIDLDEERFDLNTLINKKERLKLELIQKKEEYKNLNTKIKTAERLEKLKYKLNEKEKEWLIDTKDLLKLDATKLYPRMKYYANIFNKDINEEEFFKLMDVAAK